MRELTVAREAAEKASHVLMDLYGRVGGIRKKAHADYVTDADYRAEEIIIKTIHQTFPDDLILSEELYPDTTDLSRTWIVDGLDGTNNYVSGIPIFGTNIACYRNGKPVAAVVTIPPQGDELWASDDVDGAFHNGKPMRVSSETVIEHSSGAITTAALRIKRYHDRLQLLFASAGRLRCLGAACYDTTLVARGVFDFRVSVPEMAHDVAAPYYLIEKAGGRVSNADGSAFDLSSRAWIASNGKLHRELVALLNKD